MRIDFECSGGFAGLRLTYRADTNDLTKEVAEELMELIESSGFFDLEESEVAPSLAGPPDVFIYRLSLDEKGRRKSLSLNDVTAPPPMHRLLTLLRKLALEQRRKGK